MKALSQIIVGFPTSYSSELQLLMALSKDMQALANQIQFMTVADATIDRRLPRTCTCYCCGASGHEICDYPLFLGRTRSNFEEPELEIQLAAADMLLLQPDWALKV